MPRAFEVNFDGLVGPTHNYAGLSFGNIASARNKELKSNPREAALQGLRKMKFLSDLGVKQGILPPQHRPNLSFLRGIGYSGTDAEILARVSKECPALLAVASSASSMWAANGATTAPSADTSDRRVHFTPANLTNRFHRSLEAATTARVLKGVFANEKYFVHHPPLPGGSLFGDEGAANHTRLCRDYGEPGLHLFVFGRLALDSKARTPKRFPARQTFEASASITRMHGLMPKHFMFAQQNPKAIDQGAFHNDVVSVGNKDLLVYHEHSYLESSKKMAELKKTFEWIAGRRLRCLRVPAKKVSLSDAVRSYLFNGQLVSPPGSERMALILPEECREILRVRNYLKETEPFFDVHHFDLRQSMRNGGGPACLRLRVVLTEEELKAVNPSVLFTDTLYQKLCDWVNTYYRDRFSPKDLADPSLVDESRRALQALEPLLGLEIL